MPNHVTQKLSIRGAAAAEVIEFIVGDKTPLDFNRVIPMPVELAVDKSSDGDMGVAVLTGDVSRYLDYRWVKKLGLSTPEDFIAYIHEERADAVNLGRIHLSNERRFGFRTWYDWRIHNWGTKWNAYNVSEPEVAAEQAVLTFDTAWQPPIPVIERLSETFRCTEFVLKYFDEGWSDAGTFSALAGQFCNDCLEPTLGDEQTLALYHDIFGEEFPDSGE